MTVIGAIDERTPIPVPVIRRRRETRDVFTIELDASALIDAARPFRTGQFNMLYAFGVGEAPISISGNEARPERIAHTVRAVGPVTSALAKLRAGDVVGLRGPYGTSWPLEECLDRDVLVVAGGLGIAPLAPAIDALANEESRTGRLIVLAGARTPDDLLFRGRLARWRKADRTEVHETVDRASPQWRDHVGVVPALLDVVHVDPATTAAFVCGPEVMMRFALRRLLAKGIAPENVWLSMERSMRCAVGLCGHCQVGPFFLCKDGPVVRCDRIAFLFEKREI
jgi:NAD(P)H-flavin reductase